MSRPAIVVLLAATLLAGCVAPVGPVEVTRFHQPDTSTLGRGAISIEPAAGGDTAGGDTAGGDSGSLEFRSWAGAVARELVRVGYAEQVAGSSSAQIAQVSVKRRSILPGRGESPVSVGVGGSTGSYGSGVGVGIGLNLSGPPPEEIETQLAVTIRDRATGRALWEGRAEFTVRASSPLAQTQLGAPKMAEALFRGFPGTSGESIVVQ